MVKNLFFSYHCTPIVSQFVVSDVFLHFYFVARRSFRTPASSEMGISCDNSQRLASVGCCIKEPLLED